MSFETVTDSLGRNYFDGVYAARNDPWDFASSPYEASKYSQTLAALPCDRYRRALEIGCSIGVFSRLLAPRCDWLLAIDTSAAALERAKERCTDIGNIAFEQRSVPDEYPVGIFELTVLSEVGYYFSRPDLGRLASKISNGCTDGGDLVLVHWLPPVHDYPLTGDDVHDFFLSLNGWQRIRHAREENYRLDVLRKDRS